MSLTVDTGASAKNPLILEASVVLEENPANPIMVP